MLRHQSPDLPPLSAPTLVGSLAGHDLRTVRRSLGTHPNLVGNGASVSWLSVALPANAPARVAGGGHPLPGAGRGAARVSATQFGHGRQPAGSARLQF